MLNRDLTKLSPQAAFTYEQLVRMSPSSEEKAWQAALRFTLGPNYCSTCTPQGLGYCRCEIACNE
jgi:hypothetical protein